MNPKAKLSCPTGKVTYGSEGKALLDKERLLKADGRKTKVYRCNLCRHWHLTHSDSDERRRDRRQKRRRECKVIRLAEKEKTKDKRIRKSP